MNIPRIRLLPAFLAVAAIWILSPPATSAEDFSSVIQWYDTLGFPDVKEMPYVRVATGAPIKIGNQPFQNRYTEGFLIGEEAEAFTILVCSIATDFKDGFPFVYRTPSIIRLLKKPDAPDYVRTGYEKLDFNKVAEEALARVRAATTSSDVLQWGRPVRHRVRIFAFGRACVQKGRSDIASALMEITARIPDDQTDVVDPKRLTEYLQVQMGESVLNSAEEAFSDRRKSWSDLFEPFAGFEQRYPASPKVAYARESAALLRTMIAEEAAHHPKSFEQMSPGEQVAECIYQLRNLDTHPWFLLRQPAAGAKLPGESTIPPVQTLANIGDPAIPQLIEALDDRRYTRTMVQSINSLAPPAAMRVSDVARDILVQLSGQTFWTAKTRDGHVMGKTARQMAEAWWAQAREKGEKQRLIDATASGGSSAVLAAPTLINKYPDDAIAALMTGLRAPDARGQQSHLLEIAAELPGEAPVELLQSALSEDFSLFVRARATELLLARGHPEGLPSMIADWEEKRPRFNESRYFDQAGWLIGVLGRSGNARAIEALGKDLSSSLVEVRFAVVETLLPAQGNRSQSSEGRSVHSFSPPRDNLRLDDDAVPVVEQLLVTRLSDQERRFCLRGYFGKVSYEDPRICDFAAFALSKRWPEKYRFEWAADAAACDPQIVALQNQWRALHGLPPLTLPPPVVIPPAREADVAPLIEAFLAGSDETARKTAAAKIVETFGLSALPAVRGRLELSKNHALRPLAITLASLVREVVVEPGSEKYGADFGIDTLRGQPLEGSRLRQLALKLETKLPAELRGVSFYAERSGDGTGFKVKVAWLPGPANLATGCDRQFTVRGGGQSPFNQSGYSADRGGPTGTAQFDESAHAFDLALLAPVDGPVIVRFRIERSSP